jgi:hypothetical protein
MQDLSIQETEFVNKYLADSAEIRDFASVVACVLQSSFLPRIP